MVMGVRDVTPAEGASPPPRISVLCPVSCEIDSEPVDLGPRRQRAVLARLVASQGRVVSTDRLIDDLWNGEPPPKALAGLQVQVSNLRRVIEPWRLPRAPATVLVSEQPGYALRLPRAAVDAWAFESVVAAAEPVEPVRRLDNLDAALRLWRGEPYGVFSGETWAQPEVARLQDLRRSAVEQWAALAVDHGQAPQVAQMLPAECEDQPTREEFFRSSRCPSTDSGDRRMRSAHCAGCARSSPTSWESTRRLRSGDSSTTSSTSPRRWTPR